MTVLFLFHQMAASLPAPTVIIGLEELVDMIVCPAKAGMFSKS
jgi:hypothetical protein